MTYSQVLTEGRLRYIDAAARAFVSVDLVHALTVMLRSRHTVLVQVRRRRFGGR